MKDWLKLSGLKEAKENKDALMEFAKKRHAGAKKISDTAEKKGGPATLTYEHFRVKLPVYESVANGDFDFDKLKKDYEKLCSELHSYMNRIEKIDQNKFQQLLGKIEVLGELLIANNQMKKK